MTVVDVVADLSAITVEYEKASWRYDLAAGTVRQLAAWEAVGVWDFLPTPESPAVKFPSEVTSLVGQPVRLRVEAYDAQGGPLAFTVEDLPDGLAMDADGVITGAPEREGRYSTRFTVTDEDGHTAIAYTTWETDAPPALDRSLLDSRRSVVGESVFAYFRADDRDYPITWRITGLPDGVAREPGTSWVSGLPTTVGEWHVVDRHVHLGGRRPGVAGQAGGWLR